MRSRILLSVVLAATIAMLPGCGGRSTDTVNADGESAAAAPSSPTVGSTPRRTPHSGPSRPSTPRSSSPTIKPGGTATLPGTKPSQQHRPSTGPVRFGPVTSNDSTVNIAIDPDRTTMTTTFSALEVSVGNGESTASDATRMFPLVLPLTDGAQNATITFHASGYAFADKGATARLTLRVNGASSIAHFPAGSDDEYVETLKLPAIPASQYRLSVVVEVHQAPGSHDATALLSVLAIDAAIT